MEPAPRRRWLRLIATRAPYYLAVPASLLVFPSALPWVVLLWAIPHLVLLSLKKRPWVPLIIALALIPLKRTDIAPWMILHFALMTGFVFLASRFIRKVSSNFSPRVAPAVGVGHVALVLLFMGYREEHRSHPAVLDPGRPIVVIGDSLSVHGWPRELASLVSVPVIDRSEGGINTIEGLAKLPQAISLRPQLVVIELGGHDYLEGRGRAATKANLERMIRDVRASGAEALLFEIPRGFVFDSFRCLERELAREHDLELVTDGAIRQLVLFSPFTPLGSLTGRKLSDDGLHPNDAGHRFLAERVKDSLVRLYGTPILAAPR